MNKSRTANLIIAAMFLSVGQVLPFITGQIPAIAKVASPMHYPVLLCGIFCGPALGALIGFICPILRGILFGMPVLYPNGLSMAFELCAYGFIAGLIFGRFKECSLKSIFFSIIPAMLLGRVVAGIAQIVLLGLKGNSYSIGMFLSAYFINAAPGIIAQLIIIPVLVLSFKRYLK